MTTTKLPATYDTSHWNGIIPSIAAIVPYPLLMIPKATEGIAYVDDTFVDTFQKLKAAGVARGCYHFHQRFQDEVQQAQHFCNTIRPYVNNDDLLILDVEQGGETAAQLRTWILYVQAEFPKNQVLIYSRKNILDPIPMTQQQKDFFKQIQVWTAGYPNEPDNYPKPPLGYIPDQTKWGKVVLWQYSEHGAITGIPGETDLDWIDPVFAATLPSAPPAPVDVVQPPPYDGIEWITGQRYGYNFDLFKIDPLKVDFEVTCGELEIMSSVAFRKGAKLAVTAGEWDRISQPTDYTVSEGLTCIVRNKLAARPSLVIARDYPVTIQNREIAGTTQAFTGLRFLMQGNVIDPALYGTTKPEHTEGHARSIHCLDAHGNYIVLISEGVYPNQGLLLWQATELVQSYGAVTAFDGGGGGDAEAVLNDKILTVTENIDPSGKHFERVLPSVLLIYPKDTGAETMTDYNKIIGNDGQNHSVRASYNIRAANVVYPSTINPVKITNTISAQNGVTDADDYVYPSNIPDAGIQGGYSALKGDKWRKVFSVNDIAVEGWTAEIHLGFKQGITITPVVETPPPTTGNKPIEVSVTLSGYKPKTFIGELEPEV